MGRGPKGSRLAWRLTRVEDPRSQGLAVEWGCSWDRGTVSGARDARWLLEGALQVDKERAGVRLENKARKKAEPAHPEDTRGSGWRKGQNP